MTGGLKASFLLGLIVLGMGSQTDAASTLVFATTERRPYIGESLPNQGYVHQLVVEAYQRVGLDVEIRFYPQARALAMARNGGVDGLLPIHASSALGSDFILSAPFPGDRVGLLKKKDRSLGLDSGAVLSTEDLLETLKPFRIGVVRGALTGRQFDQTAGLNKELISSDALNLEKLYRGRIDLAVIDKFTAADLMVSQFPQMIGQLEFVHSSLAEADFHIAFSMAAGDASKAHAAFNVGLQRLVEAGRLDQILAYHGLVNDHHAASGRTKVRIAAVDNPHVRTLKRLSHRFEQMNPDIELEWMVLDEPILRLRTQADLAIGDGQFDVMAIGPYEAKNWADRGWLTPLVAFPEGYDLEDIITPVRKALSYRNRLYALPLYAESSMTYYRKDLFDQAGIQMPAAPSYDQIRQFAAQLHDPDAGVYGICLRGRAGWGGNMALVTTMVNSFGGRWFDENWNPTLDTSAWHGALGLYRELLLNHGPPAPHLLDYNRILTLFSEGHCAIWIDATSFAEPLSDPSRSAVASNLGWARAPVARTAIGAQWLWVWGLAIPAFSNEKEHAMRFITWATSPAYSETLIEVEGRQSVPPGTRHSTYSHAYLEQIPFAGAVYRAITAANPEHPTLKVVPYQGIQYVDIPEFASIGMRVGEKVEQVLKGQLGIEQALRQSQALVGEQMKASGYLTIKPLRR